MTKALIKKSEGGLWLPDHFVDFEGKSTIPSPTLANARIALNKLGMSFEYDEFKGKALAGNMPLTVGGQVSDEALSAIRVMIRGRFDFDPGKNATWDALLLFCREHSYHPIKDYLLGVQWDGTPRIERMLTDYFGAPDTPFIRGVSLLVMVASVRRL